METQGLVNFRSYTTGDANKQRIRKHNFCLEFPSSAGGQYAKVYMLFCVSDRISDADIHPQLLSCGNVSVRYDDHMRKLNMRNTQAEIFVPHLYG